jgi:hypothetical protein
MSNELNSSPQLSVPGQPTVVYVQPPQVVVVHEPKGLSTASLVLGLVSILSGGPGSPEGCAEGLRQRAIEVGWWNRVARARYGG